MERRARLQHTLWTEIPITTALGVTVVECAVECVALAAPLVPNHNHKATAFAGSINAVTTLAGWSVVWCLLDDAALPGTIVIQESTIQYRLPLTADFTARCCAPDPEQLTRFWTTLRRKQRARVELRAEIWETQRLAVVFSGRYVVQRTLE